MDSIWIPSRERAGRSATIESLLRAGVRPRVMVHESEVDAYVRAYPAAYVMDVPFYGIGATRQFILELARDNGFESIWILDDDINAMLRRPELKAPYFKISLATGLELMSHDARRFPTVGIAGPMSRQFAWSAPDRVFNRRVGIAVWLDTAGPWSYWPHFHEDTDMVLQMIEAGRSTLAWGMYAIGSAAMGKTPGGCYSDYLAGSGERDAELLVERWKDRLPGIVGSQVNDRGQTVSRINWRQLDKRAAA